MRKPEYAPHPLDKRIALVSDKAAIAPLMAIKNIHAVIWERGLTAEYTALYEELADNQIAKFRTLTNTENKGRIHRLHLGETTDEIMEIRGDNGTDVREAFQKAVPKPIYKDIEQLAGLVADLRKARMARILVFNQQAGVEVYNDMLTKHWHSHEVFTAHMTMNHAGLEILPLTSKDIKPDTMDGGEASYRNASIPAATPIITIAAGDVVVFRSTIHRKTQNALDNGRLAFAIF